MAQRDFNGTFWIRKAPTIRSEGGMFYICYDSGGAHFEFVMRKSIWEQTRRQAKQADAQFAAGKGSVSQIKESGTH